MPEDKRNLPVTSKLAYAASADLKAAHQAKIVECLHMNPKGLIYEEISVKCNMDKHAVGRRLSELERDMKIFKPGETRKTSTGRLAMVYRLLTFVDYSKALTQKTLF